MAVGWEGGINLMHRKETASKWLRRAANYNAKSSEIVAERALKDEQGNRGQCRNPADPNGNGRNGVEIHRNRNDNVSDGQET
jgi:hypothetical protein